MESIFTSTEFYVTIFVIAIALIGFILKPSNKGEAMTYFYTGNQTEASCPHETLIIEALESGDVWITHTAVRAYPESEMALAITIIGDDIKIPEKQQPHSSDEAPLEEIIYYEVPNP